MIRICDPNSLELDHEAFMKYATGIYHDAIIESVKFASDAATIGIRVHCFRPGTSRGRNGAAERWHELISASKDYLQRSL
jgi:hypothetical protein